MRKCCESYYFMFHIYFLFPVVYCARFLTIHAEGHPHTSFVQCFFRGVAGLVALGGVGGSVSRVTTTYAHY